MAPITRNNLITILAVIAALNISGCGSKSQTIVDNVPESENLFFTDDGRLFVSGGDNVFEIIQRADGSFTKLDMFHEKCLIEGITQRYDHLYAVCTKTNLAEFGSSYLLATPISPAAPTENDILLAGTHPFMNLDVIHPLPDQGIPNGLITDEFGNLFISDSVKNNIVRIALTSPTEVASVDLWANNVQLVNGLEWVGDALYVTGVTLETLTSTFEVIKRNPDGSAGERQTLFTRIGTVLDDIAYYRNGFLITDYVKGTVLFWRDGAVISETPANTFFAPTAVVPAQPPMFAPDTWVVTEKGIIFNSNPRLGNKVGLYFPEP